MLSCLFTVVHTKAVLFKSNESTKLLHGLALAGRGYLMKDWLVNTADPLPFFSAFVGFTFRYLGEWAFYGYFAILLGVYLYSILGIFWQEEWLGKSRPKLAVFFVGVMALHSELLRDISDRLFHRDLITPITYGLAQQYLVNDLFQNSLFGVFIILSILLFLRHRPYWAGAMLALASTIHSAYLLGAAALTIAYMSILFREDKSLKRPILLGLLTLALVSPTLVYDKVFLSAQSHESWHRALDILVNVRIPQHSLISRWLDAGSVARVLFILAALFITRRKRIFLILAVPFVVGTVLTVVQAATGNLALAMLAPWRISVFLVPLSVFILLASAIQWVFARWGSALVAREKTVIVLCAAAVGVLAASGLYLQIRSYRADARSPRTALFRFVDDHKGADDLYLVDPRDTRIEAFRERTGAPIVVNWKSHPYGDLEVLEWYDRFRAADAPYTAADPAAAIAALEKLRKTYGITHVVVKNGATDWLEAVGAQEVYSNSTYAVYRLPSS